MEGEVVDHAPLSNAMKINSTTENIKNLKARALRFWFETFGMDNKKEFNSLTSLICKETSTALCTQMIYTLVQCFVQWRSRGGGRPPPGGNSAPCCPPNEITLCTEVYGARAAIFESQPPCCTPETPPCRPFILKSLATPLVFFKYIETVLSDKIIILLFISHIFVSSWAITSILEHNI